MIFFFFFWFAYATNFPGLIVSILCPSNRKAGFGSLKSSMRDRNQKELQSKFCVRKEKINSRSMKYISRLKNKSKKVTVIRSKTMRLRKLRSLLHHVLVQKEAMGTTTPPAEPLFFFPIQFHKNVMNTWSRCISSKHGGHRKARPSCHMQKSHFAHTDSARLYKKHTAMDPLFLVRNGILKVSWNTFMWTLTSVLIH